MLIFYYTYDQNNDTFQCFNKDHQPIAMPISEKKIRKAFSEGFMAFVVVTKDNKTRCKKIPRQYINAPWHTKDKTIWNTYYTTLR